MSENNSKRALLKLLEHKMLWFDWEKSCKPLNLKHLAADNRQYVIICRFSLNVVLSGISKTAQFLMPKYKI